MQFDIWQNSGAFEAIENLFFFCNEIDFGPSFYSIDKSDKTSRPILAPLKISLYKSLKRNSGVEHYFSWVQFGTTERNSLQIKPAA